MTKLIANQLSLIAELGTEDLPVGDWNYDLLGTDRYSASNVSKAKLGTQKSSKPEALIYKLGTDNFSVPNFSECELGTDNFSVPNFQLPELGTENFHTPNFDRWHPPIGCFQQKWIKDHQYWYWRYYDNRGKKASLYLAKDYNKAIRKAMKIGLPPDAKLSPPKLVKADPQSTPATAPHLVDLAQTAHGASRSTRAA